MKVEVTAGHLSGKGAVLSRARFRRSPHEPVCHTVRACSGFASRTPEAGYDGGRLTSDGGVRSLAEADAALGPWAASGAMIPEWRRGPVHHGRAILTRQRAFQSACGDEDQDTGDTLRTEPLLKLTCGQMPRTGYDLARAPTPSRLKNAVARKRCDRLAVVLGEVD